MEEQFQLACARGDLNTAKRIYRENPNLNTKANYHMAFKLACKKWNFSTVKWLKQIGAANNATFRSERNDPVISAALIMGLISLTSN
jgi:hypothetical protein